MTKYEAVKLAIYERCNDGLISEYECELLLEAAEERLGGGSDTDRTLPKNNTTLMMDLMSSSKTTKKEVEALAKTWEYKPAIRKLEQLIKDAKNTKQSLDREKTNGDSSRYESYLRKINEIIVDAEREIKEIKKKDTKKQLNRFNNKYWIDYTKKHNQAFQDVERELLGYNTKAGKKHDMDKYVMYHLLPAPIAHALHVQFSHHHKKHARTEEDFRNMMIDMECNRRTKPDKQMKPYQVIDKFYPELKSTMDPILQKYGLPRNAEEDRMMEMNKRRSE